ncbi:AAA family ATPase [Halobacillus salinus]|uniref:AAA family ATPase n=1 Tax=Halobacillus salinus TaxID=192814 RepID=UPI0009A79C72|nr:AAA family ATPase [Halobacillus salinus]
MRRLAILTVGKTHSGKSTFAKQLEKELPNSLVVDQDNHAAFINSHYEKLQPKTGPNTLKHAISKLIVDYAKETTDMHMVACSANRTRAGREYLLETIYPRSEFVRIIVHFDIPDDILKERVLESQRSTGIFRGEFTSFEEVLTRQQSESESKEVVDPVVGEADYLFVISQNDELESVIKQIIHISKRF